VRVWNRAVRPAVSTSVVQERKITVPNRCGRENYVVKGSTVGSVPYPLASRAHLMSVVGVIDAEAELPSQLMNQVINKNGN
jgi:hypothetical protein